MRQCVVIADDLTGANATGALLKKMDYQTFTVMNAEKIQLSTLNDCDCVMYPTDSRGIDEEQAYNRVYNVAKLLKMEDVKVYAKRIDSTLRGNLGAEVDGILDALGDEYIAVVAPCFPASGRIVIGDFMLVNGLPLHKTEAALDPKAPVRTSEVSRLFKQQSKYRVSALKMSEMMEGKHTLAKHIIEATESGSRILVMDCVTQEDLDLIADAVITSGIKFAAVDPGVFTATMARKLIVPADHKKKHRILAVVGSVNPVTRAQMEELWLTQRAVCSVLVKTNELIKDEARRKAEIKRVVTEVLNHATQYEILTVTGDGIYPEYRISFADESRRLKVGEEELSQKLNQAFAEITYQIFHKNHEFKGLYTSGGDVTVAVCERFETAGLRLLDEVLPLAAYGTFIKGEMEDVHIVTKGGMVGEKDAVNQCITYLKQKLYM